VRILIWDSDATMPSFDGTIILWSTFGKQPLAPNIVSLPKYINENAEKIRARYLSYINEWSFDISLEKPIFKELELYEGFSYWWITEIAQKDIYGNTPEIFTVLKFIALDHIISNVRNIEIETKSDLINQIAQLQAQQ